MDDDIVRPQGMDVKLYTTLRKEYDMARSRHSAAVTPQLTQKTITKNAALLQNAKDALKEHLLAFVTNGFHALPPAHASMVLRRKEVS